jgi:hypothetical protein
MFLFWFILLLIFFLYSSNLLLSLLLLEILRFLVIYYLVFSLSLSFFSDFIIIVLFSVFVIEGVIGLSGLITLVRFSGSDYVSSFSFIKL